MMAASNKTSIRSPGRTPPFILIGLLLILGFLCYNYWSLNNANAELSAELHNVRVEKKDTDQINAELERKRSYIKGSLIEAEENYNQARKQLKIKDSEIVNMKNDLNIKLADAEKLRIEKSECETNYTTLKSYFDTLKDQKEDAEKQLVEEKEKSSTSVKEILVIAAKRIGSIELSKALSEANLDVDTLMEGIDFPAPAILYQQAPNQQQQALKQQLKDPNQQHQAPNQQQLLGPNQQQQAPNQQQQAPNQQQLLDPNQQQQVPNQQQQAPNQQLLDPNQQQQAQNHQQQALKQQQQVPNQQQLLGPNQQQQAPNHQQQALKQQLLDPNQQQQAQNQHEQAPNQQQQALNQHLHAPHQQQQAPNELNQQEVDKNKLDDEVENSTVGNKSEKVNEVEDNFLQHEVNKKKKEDLLFLSESDKNKDIHNISKHRVDLNFKKVDKQEADELDKEENISDLVSTPVKEKKTGEDNDEPKDKSDVSKAVKEKKTGEDNDEPKDKSDVNNDEQRDNKIDDNGRSVE